MIPRRESSAQHLKGTWQQLEKLLSKGNYVIPAYPEAEFIPVGPGAEWWFLHCPVRHLKSDSQAQPKVSCLHTDKRLFWAGDLSEQLILQTISILVVGGDLTFLSLL